MVSCTTNQKLASITTNPLTQKIDFATAKRMINWKISGS